MADKFSRRLLLLSPLLLLADNVSARGGRGGRGGRGYSGGRRGSLSGKALLWLLGIGAGIFALVKLNDRKNGKEEGLRRAAEAARLEAIERAKPSKDQWDALSLCLLCGSPMVTRIAKTGRSKGKQFLGCTSYPRCLGTRKIEKAAAKPKSPGRNAS